jgi:hypothetical protein
MKLTINYRQVSVALDIAAAGIGALGGPLNAMTAVIGKRGLEGALRHSARKIAEWRNSSLRQPAPEPEILSPSNQEHVAHEEHSESWRLQSAPATHHRALALLQDDLMAL